MLGVLLVALLPCRRQFYRRASLFDDWRRVIGDTPGSREEPPRFRLAPLLLPLGDGLLAAVKTMS